MKILKVGTRFINVDAVARVDVIDIDEHEKIARVTMLSTAGVTNEHGSSVKSEVLSFCDEEAEIIANYFEALASQTTENPWFFKNKSIETYSKVLPEQTGGTESVITFTEKLFWLLRFQRLTIQQAAINQVQYLGNALLLMPLVVVSLSLRKVFRILPPILAVVANDLLAWLLI